MTTRSRALGREPQGELSREILRRTTPVLATAGIDADEAICRLVGGPGRLDVQFHVPVAVSPAVERALAVRVLDAVRAAGTTFGPVRVAVVRTPGSHRERRIVR